MDLQKSVLLNNLKKAQELLGTDENDEYHEGENEEDFVGDLPSFTNNAKKQPKSSFNSGKNLPSETALPQWNDFLQHRNVFTINNHRFNYFYSLFDTNAIENCKSIPVFIFHHGAGSSALTFAMLIKILQEKYAGACACFTFDARGHGGTQFIDDSVDTYSLNDFVDDFNANIENFIDNHLKPCSPASLEKISITLVGHSLGGSICTNVFPILKDNIKNKVVGVCMLDIVEEAAILALDRMELFLQTTPFNFNNMKDAISWHVNRGMPNDKPSAEISIPPLFKQDIISGGVSRVTDLSFFTSYWSTWFKGLSSKFVDLKTSKLLILAGNDNLDKDLIVGQMQGKYQLVIFQESGHFIQEDNSLKTAITLMDFMHRNDNKNVVIKTNWGAHK
ncbi:related to Protein phosphatase methylesterase 1 [Saccharomycodes ludwigii]|uniref:Protein phosphatase methylesterase 1 n=1 Tax=Saccharomycodes ludwigii TaxID=36035 RepID=A0A376B6W3_9ASCO|nr:hypothetical protein SCDLUD_004566 [Saccharomycodes ludwigii]KAH3899139.1 hypothetical protein SCDLUD_004566 [Saccharomycodes ludwigii]SSD60447.1 related to Protein phosphatase methylesterase 1 [Saccharomycodes ludwigii]